MAEYIEREALIADIDAAMDNAGMGHVIGQTLKRYVKRQPAADVVPKGAYDQVAWERDIAIQQLREYYGVGLGEKKAADVVEVVHGRWEFDGSDLADIWKCSACGDDWFF